MVALWVIVKQQGAMVITVQLSRQDMAEMRLAAPVARSSFVRRLLQAHDDLAKQRIRAWLMKIDYAQLDVWPYP